MTIYELSDLLDIDIVVRRYAGQNNIWRVEFDHVEIKDNEHSCILQGITGNANTEIIDAIKDYVSRIRGKWLVYNAMDKQKRKEFRIPSDLTI